MIIAVVGTFFFGWWGFAETHPDDRYRDYVYRVLMLFAVNESDVAGRVGWQLDVARWLGAIVWLATISAVLIHLFREHVLALILDICTRFKSGHVIVAGLGPPELELQRLVERLCGRQRDVVVIEPNGEHPGLESCRDQGAICFVGSPLDQKLLERAQLGRAGTLLVMGGSEEENLRVYQVAESLIREMNKTGNETHETALADLPPIELNSVIVTRESRLLDLLRRRPHRVAIDARPQQRFFNEHEMVARTMLRECLIGRDVPALNRALMLGVGEQGRLGEALVARAARDRWIESRWEGSLTSLKIDVYDGAASPWCDSVADFFGQDFSRLVTLHPHDRGAGRTGFHATSNRQAILQANYDAVFICLSDEPLALVQAMQLDEILPKNVPIIVRVRDEQEGFGRVQQECVSERIHVVGAQNGLFDLAESLDPLVEMLAHVTHHDYLLKNYRMLQDAKAAGDPEAANAIATKAAYKPWRELAPVYRKANRLLVDRLFEHLRVPATATEPGRTFTLEYAPRELISPDVLYQLSATELDRMAEREHELWCQATEPEWQLGGASNVHGSDPDARKHPNLVPWSVLDRSVKEYDYNIIRRLPYVFARGDYKVVEVKP